MNDRYSRELFEWLVQNNFTRNDYFITLTFSEKVSEQDGKRLFGNYIRRLRRLYHSKSAALKYIYVEEYGETSGLYHVHLLLGSAGGIISKEAPINVSNVAVVDPKSGKATKIGFKEENGKKVRFARKSGEVIDKK